jgi:hypothetical protein
LEEARREAYLERKAAAARKGSEYRVSSASSGRDSGDEVAAAVAASAVPARRASDLNPDAHAGPTPTPAPASSVAEASSSESDRKAAAEAAYLAALAEARRAAHAERKALQARQAAAASDGERLPGQQRQRPVVASGVRDIETAEVNHSGASPDTSFDSAANEEKATASAAAASADDVRGVLATIFFFLI